MATQGPLSPGTVADDATVGTKAWSTPNNAKTSNNVYTTAGFDGGSLITQYLKATNFGFTIPTGVTINGIIVSIQNKAEGGNNECDNEVKIVKSDGSIGSTNKASATKWLTTKSTFTYGTSSDLWGESWDSSKINNANFGVVLSAKGTDPGFYVDYISITVYYTPPTIYTMVTAPAQFILTGQQSRFTKIFENITSIWTRYLALKKIK
jgi:hypothetical protein